MMLVRWVLIGSVMVSFAGCRTERDEARILFDRLDAVDVQLDHAARAPRVDDLQALSLEEAQLARMRDDCVAAHRALIEAEAQQQTARKALSRAEAQTEGSLDPAEAARLTEVIGRSQEAYERAKALFPACERHKRSLAMRFSGRRDS
jgi:hypothetical protein